MDILGSFFIFFAVVWLFEGILFRSRREKAEERHSFSLIFWTMLIIIGLSLVFQGSPARDAIRISALLLLYGGVFLRYAGIVQLKRQFTRHVSVEPGDELVSSGPYRYVRHPLYAGLLLITAGFPLYFGLYALTCIGFLAMFLALHHRIKLEEEMLTDSFGSAYTDWAKERKRLIPFIY
ncbi:methyltransferase family protein [Exiguobacterium flavidum]|uniref:methyltransferase family protein n=1 Tax=Exiguobacterium flavidum TaxID=2184695 RepID=UPI000DF77B8A|nr:isoprenylcysteine carboxylmethyltransferase family protein [Exiguobacterium flavidum]